MEKGKSFETDSRKTDCFKSPTGGWSPPATRCKGSALCWRINIRRKISQGRLPTCSREIYLPVGQRWILFLSLIFFLLQFILFIFIERSSRHELPRPYRLFHPKQRQKSPSISFIRPVVGAMWLVLNQAIIIQSVNCRSVCCWWLKKSKCEINIWFSIYKILTGRLYHADWRFCYSPPPWPLCALPTRQVL